MKALIRKTGCLVVAVSLTFLQRSDVFAAESSNAFGTQKEQENNYILETDVLPLQYAFVDGDEEKFRAHHWLTDNYNAGVKEIYAFYRLPNDVTVRMEGQVFPQNNEYVGEYTITKKTVGYIKFDYQEFRRYYDSSGGVYHPFKGRYRSEGNELNESDAPKRLALDIGHFGVEAGLRMEDLPHVTLGYEREFRDGSKSRLTWGSVIVNGVTRKIAPAFADIKERVDKFDIEVDHTIKGYELRSEQKWEQVRIDQTRTELQSAEYWDTTVANKYILRQQIKPESDIFSTIFKVAKWFFKEKLYTSSGYRFFKIDNQELEDMREFDEFLNPISISNSENRFNSRAENSYDSHTWVQNVMFIPFKWLNLNAKLKSEFLKREGESTYNVETTNPPDNQINRFDVSNTKMDGQRWGEGLSMRISAIPRTALYSELEFEQDRLPMDEDRDSIGGQSSASANEVFSRETLTFIQRGIWTIGLHAVPISLVDVTAHFRRLWKGTDYDDIRETVSNGVSKSAFFDGQDTGTNEFLTRLALKLSKYFQPAFRYIHRSTRYDTSAEAQASVASGVESNNFIADVISQPLDNVLAMASFSHLSATTWTPAKDIFISTLDTPEFTSDVNTFTFTVSYSPKSNVSWINSASYSRADNFNDFTAVGLPLGADYRMMNVESGMKWTFFTDQLAIEPKYNLYHYNANENFDLGDYTAHVLTLEFSLPWG